VPLLQKYYKANLVEDKFYREHLGGGEMLIILLLGFLLQAHKAHLKKEVNVNG